MSDTLTPEQQQAVAELRQAVAALPAADRQWTPREKFDRKLPMTDAEWVALPNHVRNRHDREKYRAKPVVAKSATGGAAKPPKWYESLPDLPPLSKTPLGHRDWRTWIGHAFVINLDRRPDRMDAFRAGIPSDWPLPPVERIAAVDGAKVPTPAGWRAGGGAYGLYSTYRQIIERGLCEGWDKPILLLEDDAVFVPGFARRFADAMANVPEDFDAVWIGGQHRAKKLPVAEGVVRPTGIHRTHAWIVHPRFFKTLLKIWHAHQGHVDHAITACCSRFRILSLDPFLAAQSGGRSNIAGRTKRTEYWDHRTKALFEAVADA